MGYSAGNLELSILGFSDKAVSSIDATAKALRRLASASKLINKSDLVFTGQLLEHLFGKLAKSINAIDTKNIENLASAAKSLSSISKLANLEKMDFAKIGNGFSTLSVAIQPFLDKVKDAEASLTALYGILQKSSSKKIQGLLGGASKGSGNSGSVFGFAKRFLSIYMLRRMGHFMADLVQAGSDYNETLNLWQVAMRNNLDVADQFVNKMQRAYGISTKTLMNAQAIFKNMIGSLGQISDATAYALSEALVQMSADFASLYNVTIESAFQKMQAMLAGQVRPIRSAGLDMTETTLFMFYQQLGGTKTMRQLNRTEKQLLSILAVYKQMDSAGALGDMSKTLNQFANQSRMMKEYWIELKTWSGLLLKDLFDDWGILVKINALLITATEVVKAIAKSRGLGDENFLTGMFETAEATNDEVDELQGKLLDFDKFRSLEGASTTPLAIDEKLLQAITGYSSKIDQAENAAQKLADTWLKFWINEETGGLTEDADRVLTVMEGLVKVLGILLSIKVAAWLGHLVKGLFAVKIAGESVSTIALTILIYSVLELIDAIRNGDDGMALFAGSIALVSGAFIVLNSKMAQTIAMKIGAFFTKLATSINTATVSTQQLGLALIAMIGSFMIVDSVINQFEGNGRKIASICAIVVGAIMAVTAALVAMNSTVSWGTMLPVLLAGVGTAIAGVKGLTPKVDMYASGASDIDGGTLFVAGEMGKTEAVYTGSNGKTNVANVRQMEQAFYNALSRHSREGNGTIVVQTYLDGEKVYENTTSKAKARGNVWAKV